MSENLLMLIYFAVFCILSFFILRWAYKREKWTLWITIPLYFVWIFIYYYAGVDSLNEALDGTEYYIYWGHASTGLVVLTLGSLLVGLVSVVILLINRLSTGKRKA